MPSNGNVQYLVDHVDTVVSPVVATAKQSIIASAPWALRGPLKLAWPWIIGSLLPLLLRFAVEAIIGRYGQIFSSMLALAMPSLQKILSEDLIRFLKILLNASETQVSQLSEPVRASVSPLQPKKEWGL